MSRIASGTPNPDDPMAWRCALCSMTHYEAPKFDEQCLDCGRFVRACGLPMRHGRPDASLLWREHHGECKGELSKPEPMERYVSGYPASYVVVPVRDGRKR